MHGHSSSRLLRSSVVFAYVFYSELRLVVAILYLLNIAGFRETSVRDNDLCRYRSSNKNEQLRVCGCKSAMVEFYRCHVDVLQ